MSLLEDIRGLEAAVGESIVGQREVIRRLLIGLLAGGNLLIEGLPGLAKDPRGQGHGTQPGG